MKPQVRNHLLQTLQSRFETNMHRHPGLSWSAVQERPLVKPAELASLEKMEATGGEPNVVGHDAATGASQYQAPSGASAAR